MDPVKRDKALKACSDMEIKSLWGNTNFDAIVSQSLAVGLDRASSRDHRMILLESLTQRLWGYPLMLVRFKKKTLGFKISDLIGMGIIRGEDQCESAPKTVPCISTTGLYFIICVEEPNIGVVYRYLRSPKAVTQNPWNLFGWNFFRSNGIRDGDEKIALGLCCLRFLASIKYIEVLAVSSLFMALEFRVPCVFKWILRFLSLRSIVVGPGSASIKFKTGAGRSVYTYTGGVFGHIDNHLLFSDSNLLNDSIL
ncbi:hypothetical protein Tco_0946386 [Tanacetum coccineum]